MYIMGKLGIPKNVYIYKKRKEKRSKVFQPILGIFSRCETLQPCFHGHCLNGEVYFCPQLGKCILT